ncbi:MAG: hypothetical protein WDO13_19580 [Verrucomicrobiota bacterium]
MDFLNSLPPGRSQGNLISAITNSLAQEDPAKALQWAGSLPDGEGKTRAISTVVNQWAQSDPGRRGQLCAGSARRAGARPGDCSRWWGAGRRATRRRRRNSRGASRTGRRRRWPTRTSRAAGPANDVTAASSWLMGLPAGGAKDSAISAFSNQVFEDDPEAAYKWAESIGDDNQRQGAVFSLLNRWVRSDPSAAAGGGADLDAARPAEGNAVAAGQRSATVGEGSRDSGQRR